MSQYFEALRQESESRTAKQPSQDHRATRTRDYQKPTNHNIDDVMRLV
jgi:hypothetical protein